MNTGGFDLLLVGEYFDAMLEPLVQVNFGTELFYLSILLASLGLIYMKTRSIGLVSLTLTLTSVVIIPNVLPIARIYFGVLLFLGVVGLLYSIFRSE